MISKTSKILIDEIYSKRLSIYLNDITSFIPDVNTYETFCDFIINYILDDYSRANDVVKVYDENEELVEISLFQFLINLYFLEFNFMYRVPVTREWMVDVDKSFLASYHDYIEEELGQKRIYPIIKKRKLNGEEVLSKILTNITERMTKLTDLIAPIAAPTLDLFDISEFCNRDSRFNDLLNTELDETKSFEQLEHELVEDGKKLKNIILTDNKSCLVPFLESKCLNDQQLTQLFVAVGPRMSSSNVVMSHIMKTSYLNGLQNVGDLIAESEIASKALIYKKKFVGVSGYMSRETNLSGMNLKIDFSMDDCGTKHFINYKVKTQKHLNLICGKNIILPNGKLKEVTKSDTNLIGTTVKLRSMCCCAHPDRKYVCKACYGNPKNFKEDYMIGGATSTEIENPLSNAVMSVKHHTGTKTKEFDNPELLKYFNNDESQLVLKNIEDANKISILFNKEYIEDIIDRLENDQELDDEDIDDDVESEDVESSSVVSKMLTDLSIVIKNYDEFTNEETETVTEVKLDGTFLTFSDNMLNLNNAKKIELPIDSENAILHLSDIKPGTPVFNIKYITADTSRYLKELKNIIERAKPIWYDNLDDPINDFADLVNEAGLKDKEMVYLEPIIYSLTRDPNNIMKRPDFSKDVVPVSIISLKQSIFKGDLYSAIIYQEITKLFKDRDSFFKDPSIGDGLHDSLFKTSITHDFSYMKKALKKAKLI